MGRLIRSVRSLDAMLFEGAVIYGGNALIAVIDGSDRAASYISETIRTCWALSNRKNDAISSRTATETTISENVLFKERANQTPLARPASKSAAEMHVYGAQAYDAAFCACEIMQYGSNALRQCRRPPGHGPENLFCAHHAAGMMQKSADRRLTDVRVVTN